MTPPTPPGDVPERWQRLNDLFHAAIGRDAAERAAFLAKACAGEAELQADVERLVRGHERAEAFIGEILSRAAAADAMTLDAGTRLGPYEIAAPLGAGGMGEVYRARDTRLDRTVAVKILPSDLAWSAALRQRFEREARAISALDHPHICVLHDRYGRLVTTPLAMHEIPCCRPHLWRRASRAAEAAWPSQSAKNARHCSSVRNCRSKSASVRG